MAERFKSQVDAQALGAKLRNARKKANKTLAQIAKRSGIHHSQISRIERGRVATLNETVQLLCTLMKVSAPSTLTAGAPPTTAALCRRIEGIMQSSPSSAAAIDAMLDAIELLSIERSSTG